MIDNTLCACGCGEVLYPFDKRGRPRRFIAGHSARIIKYKLIAEYVVPENKKCTFCLETKAIDQFYYKTYTSKTTGEKYKRFRVECISCSKLSIKNYIIDNYDLVYSKKKANRAANKNDIKYHVQEKISGWRKKSVVKSDLTIDYLVDLYHKQAGNCYYTGTRMIFGWADGKIHHDSLSLDKKDPAKGYTKENVVWCSYLVNTMKNNLSEDEFYLCIRKILQLKVAA